MASLHDDYVKAKALVDRVEIWLKKEEEAFMAHWHATQGGTPPAESLATVQAQAVAKLQETPSKAPDMAILQQAHDDLKAEHTDLQAEHAATKEDHANVVAALEADLKDAKDKLDAKETPEAPSA